MKSKIMKFFSDLGRSLMMPVAALAACGIILGITSALLKTQVQDAVPFLTASVPLFIITTLNKVSGIVFTLLPVLFAISIAFGLAKEDKGVAAFAGFIGYYTFLVASSCMISTGIMDFSAMKISNILGVDTVDMGALAGIMAGLVTAKLHNKYHKVQFPAAIAFYGGKRFVALVVLVSMTVIGLVMPLIWAPISVGIDGLGRIIRLISLNEALINGSIDNRQLKDLAKKILNINKYKTVMLNELSINMMENGYDTIYINRIKELADLLYAEWSDYVTVSVSKIKRKRFDSPEAVTESIEKMEDEIVSITKGYIDFLEKDEGTDRENKKISNEIIFVEEGKIIFSITDGKTHNFWFEDKAPKYPLLKNCNDDKIFAKARILFNQESEENLYQAGIYVKSAEDKVYYMAIDNDRNCILDTIGENNRKEEFDNTNEYLIKMNLEADCLKVQFISDASTKELKMMIERLAPVEVGLMVKTWGNGGFLEVDFKESQAIISNK